MADGAGSLPTTPLVSPGKPAGAPMLWVPERQPWRPWWSICWHVCGEWKPRPMDRLDRCVRVVRLHAGIGYVCPNDEHEGRGQAIRKAREAGLEDARLRRLAYHREQHPAAPPRGPCDVD
jgi:hypothetical protein